MTDAHVAPLRVLLISDGRPGHYRQSEGIVAALRRRGEVAVDRLDLRLRLPLPKAFVPKAALRLPPGLFLRLFHGLSPQRLTRPDVIVSSGGTTLGANVALAALWGVPNVFSGSTRGFPPDAFRLVLTPYASVGGTAANIVAGPKPTPFDPGCIPPPRAMPTAADLDGARVSVLVGGPTPYADFNASDWERLAGLIRSLAESAHCRLTVVTSPRTPEDAYRHILPLSGPAVSIIDFRTAGPGSIEAAFDCDLVLVTSDSMSMMTEAALSQRPAIGLAPARTGPNRDDEAIADLVAAGWLAVVRLVETDAVRLAAAAASLTPIQHNHLDRLADLVLDATSLGHAAA